MTLGRCVIATIAVLALTTPLPARADHDPPDYSDRQIQDLIDFAFERLPSLLPRSDEPYVTGDPVLDDRIWRLAYDRGYELQPSAVPEDLVSADGALMQVATAVAWEELQQAAAVAGHHMAITSAHRGLDEQREIFTSRLVAVSDEDLDRRLARAAPPGASRHHTGYALDIREVGDIFGDFGATASYRWLVADGYHNAMRYGFLPSYPPSITDAGPNPEPWEWVYVGEDVIFHDGPFWDVLPNHLFATSIGWMSTTDITRGCSSDGEFFCPALSVDRGQMAAFLRRALVLPFVSGDRFTDDESSIFERDIDAVAAVGITRGCNPPDNTRYCPRLDVDRAAMAAFLVRALGLPSTDTDYFDDDEGSIFEGDINALAEADITRGCGNRRYCPNEPISRGEMAAMLFRARARLP